MPVLQKLIDLEIDYGGWMSSHMDYEYEDV